MYPNTVIVEHSKGVYKVYDPSRRIPVRTQSLAMSLAFSGLRSTGMLVGYCINEKEVRQLYAKPMKINPFTADYNDLIPF